MPTAEDVHKMITGPVREGIFFKGRKLSFRVATDNPMLTPVSTSTLRFLFTVFTFTREKQTLKSEADADAPRTIDFHCSPLVLRSMRKKYIRIYICTIHL